MTSMIVGVVCSVVAYFVLCYFGLKYYNKVIVRWGKGKLEWFPKESNMDIDQEAILMLKKLHEMHLALCIENERLNKLNDLKDQLIQKLEEKIKVLEKATGLYTNTI
jgi:hypothetical protein